jgi:hypothetical protein
MPASPDRRFANTSEGSKRPEPVSFCADSVAQCGFGCPAMPEPPLLALTDGHLVDCGGYRSFGVYGRVNQHLSNRQVAGRPFSNQLDVDHCGELGSAGATRIGAVSLRVDSAIVRAGDLTDAIHAFNVEVHFGVCAAVCVDSCHGDTVDFPRHEDAFSRALVEEHSVGRDRNGGVRDYAGAG